MTLVNVQRIAAPGLGRLQLGQPRHGLRELQLLLFSWRAPRLHDGTLLLRRPRGDP